MSYYRQKRKGSNSCVTVLMVGWLVVLGITALWDSISVYIGPSPRERKKEWRNDKWEKNVQTAPPSLTASAVGHCPTLIRISRTPRHWKVTQHHRTTRPPPRYWQKRSRHKYSHTGHNQLNPNKDTILIRIKTANLGDVSVWYTANFNGSNTFGHK